MQPFLSKIAAFLKPKRRWFQYSLRTLLVFMAVFAVWLGMWAHRARQQKQAVAAIEKLGGTVYYDYQVTTDSRGWFSKPCAVPKPPGPAWLRSILADDPMASVVHVNLKHIADLTDNDLIHLQSLPHS